MRNPKLQFGAELCQSLVRLTLVLTSLNVFATSDDLVLKPQPPLVDKVSVENAKKLLTKKAPEKNSLYFIEGVAYYEDAKYDDAYKVLNKVGELPYLDAYVKYYKGMAILNSSNTEADLKKGLEFIYYSELNSSVLADSIKEKAPLFELKLAKIMLDNKHCNGSLYHYAMARTKGLADKLDDEFSLVNSYAKLCDKKAAVSLFLDLYTRFGDKAVKLFNDLNADLKKEVTASIELSQKAKETTPSKPVVQNPEQNILDSIKGAVLVKDYSKFVESSKEYLRLYSGSQKQQAKFYSNFNSFIEGALLQKTRSVSYFEKVFNYYEKDQLEKTLFKVWQSENWDGAKDILEIMQNKFPGYDKAYYLKGLLFEDTKKYSKAYDSYSYVVDHFPNGKLYASSLFKLAWLKMLDGRNADCVKGFDRYINEGADNYDWAITSGHYYKAKCLQKQDLKDEAKAAKLELIAKYPFSFYSLLAMDELGMKIPEELETRIQPQIYTAEPITAKELSAMNTAIKLVRCGLNEYAKKELSFINLDKFPPEYVETISKLYIYAGYNELAMQASTALLNRLKVFVSREHVEYHFPKHYFDTVKKYAEKMELDPFLVMAIMKRESAFNKDAVSRSGAIGLMQLMPATAARFQTSKKDNINDSGTNIKLAATYLKDLVKRYNGNLAYAAAAYNAGEESLDRWIKWYGGKLSGTEFIENIPYSETRAYVKSVLGNYFMYNAVYLKKHVTFDEVVKGGEYKNGGL